MQLLCRGGFLVSMQGTNGGYKLAKEPAAISALEVIRTIDGPVLLADCFHDSKECEQMSLCTVKEPLRKVHEGILRMLAGITISDLIKRDACEAPGSAGPMVQIESLRM
jgi:Rrf2 family protein